MALSHKSLDELKHHIPEAPTKLPKQIPEPLKAEPQTSKPKGT